MEIVRESFFEVIKKSIGVEPEESIIPLKRGYLVSIEMIGANKDVFLVFNKPFLRTMCHYFLSEDDPDNASLEDMARVLAQRSAKNFNISTPDFLGIRVITNYDQGMHFRLERKGHCSIFVRNKT